MTSTEFYSVVSGFIAIAVTLLGIYLSHKANFSNAYEKQFNETYAPLFISLEPYLYRNLPYDAAKEYAILFEKTIKEHYVLCHPSFIEYASLFCTAVKNNESYEYFFKKLCAHVDSYYDKLRRNIKLPLRGISYRLQFEQYKSKSGVTLAIIIYIGRHILKGLLKLLVIFIVLIALTMIAKPLLEPLLLQYN
ncbi:MAG: hypothetical protein FIA99_05465 [Ruminiclostridium sp.]|nr:hypothetical protein [Ruminiclostridium sp.]